MPRTKVPFVSVCIPTYGHNRFLPQALESVLGQSIEDLEIIVSADGPEHADETAALVRAFNDNRIRFHHQPSNTGVAENRNACLGLASGHYIAWLDADDIYEQDALERLTNALEANRGAAFAHGGFKLMDADGNDLRSWSPALPDDAVEPSRAAFRELAACNYVTTSTVMVRRTAQERAGNFEPSIGRSSTDWNMWLRLALLGDVAYVRQPIARYRLHADSITAHTSPSGERLKCDVRAVLKVLVAHRDEIPDHPDVLALAKAGLAIRWLLRAEAEYREGEARSARLAAVQAYALARRLGPLWAWQGLFNALLGEDEYGLHRASRAVLAPLYSNLVTTRYAEQVRKLAVADQDWQASIARCACVVRRATDEHSLIAAIDKHDPALLHFSDRKGLHFPPDGAYPRDDDEAIQGVETLAEHGVRYLVIPSFSFWWLDFYQGFAAHLQTHYSTTWDDTRCKIYELC